MNNQPREKTMLPDNTSTTQHGSDGGEPAQHQASKHRHNEVNDFTSSESSNRTKKEIKREMEGEEEEEAMESSSSSSSSFSSSAAPVAKQMRIIGPASLCKINADVLRLLMKYVLVDDLKKYFIRQ